MLKKHKPHKSIEELISACYKDETLDYHPSLRSQKFNGTLQFTVPHNTTNNSSAKSTVADQRITLSRKQIALILFSVVLCVFLSVKLTLEIDEYQHKQNAVPMEMTVSYELQHNNSVGGSWNTEYKITGIPVLTDKNTKYKVWIGASIKIKSTITERDSVDDVGTTTTKKKISEEDLRNGFEVKHTVTVRENRGRYSGNTAKWIATYTFKPTKPYYIPQK